MATVTSLTETRIQELLAGWEDIGLSQEEINALVIQLRTNVQSFGLSLDHFDTVVRPQIEAEVANASNALSDLNDNQLPTLRSDLDQAALEVAQLTNVTIPSIQADMDATMTNVSDRPNVYVQDEPPTNPDDDDRELVVGDSWFDSNDGNKQRVWNGVEWSTFNVDVADFSLTVRKFLTTKHQIY